LPRNLEPDRQILEVAGRYDLYTWIKPFSAACAATSTGISEQAICFTSSGATHQALF
jgi:hypothetical protein